jgi:hypothetical protein
LLYSRVPTFVLIYSTEHRIEGDGAVAPLLFSPSEVRRRERR